jgi:predicted metal-dependent hydrolase
LVIEEKSNKYDKSNDDDLRFPGTKFRWVNDAIYLENLQKIVMATDDHHMTFYGNELMMQKLQLLKNVSVWICKTLMLFHWIMPL